MGTVFWTSWPSFDQSVSIMNQLLIYIYVLKAFKFLFGKLVLSLLGWAAEIFWEDILTQKCMETSEVGRKKNGCENSQFCNYLL